jgi:nucleoid-associated protein YgaU
MTNPTRTLWILGLLIVFAGCSGSSVPEEGDDAAAASESLDAGTDAVPAASAEGDLTNGLDSLPADTTAEAPTDAPTDTASALPSDSPTEAPANDVAAAMPADTSSTPSFSGSGQSTTYTVKSGDTLMKIAFELYGDLYQWKRIYDSNKEKIADQNRLEKGTVLTVEAPASPISIERNGERYLIKTGDTLARISDDVYGSERKWKKIWENNRQMIQNPNRIYAGFFLYYLMSDEDQREKEEFLKQKGNAPLAGAAHESPSTATAAAGGLIDPSAVAPAPETRTPAAK